MKSKWILANTTRRHVPGVCTLEEILKGVFQAEGENGPRLRQSGKNKEQEVGRMWEAVMYVDRLAPG